MDNCVGCLCIWALSAIAAFVAMFIWPNPFFVLIVFFGGIAFGYSLLYQK